MEVKPLRNLVAFVVVLLVVTMVMDFHDKGFWGGLVIVFPRILSIYLCIGSWHILNDAVKGRRGTPEQLFLWPKRYFGKK